MTKNNVKHRAGAVGPRQSTKQNERGSNMNEKAKMMINMAESIAKINGVDIERLSLEKVHMGPNGRFDHYVLTVWFSDEKNVCIRQDCSIIEE